MNTANVTAATHSDTLIGMAMLGKITVVLLFIIALILLLSYVVKRSGLHGMGTNGKLKVISSTAVGAKERVVIVEVDDTWLVLGVASGQVSKLHQMPAQIKPAPEPTPQSNGFTRRFTQALKQQSQERLKRSSQDEG
ncbi:flagellar biosynthetic protein FliO [Thiopseudomonas alkaliphila]|uniref:flagellar biosynthetic protein FliO n=1 Tax=Thiopseudomonas alkaliphila TaxID=1697053 RepID=UPI003571248C